MSIFREYDIRGIFGEDLNESIIFNIGYQLGVLIKQNQQNDVVIGYDARVHSKTLLHWLSNGLRAQDIEIFCMDMAPTPVGYFATYHTIDNISCKNSIMITGSHNPPQYNGFKITLNQKPFYGQAIIQLKAAIQKNFIAPQNFTTPLKKLNALEEYIDFLSKHFEHLKDFPYEVALDYGNGVGALAMKKILENLNIKALHLFDMPDGSFPNHHPDPSEEKNLIALKESMQNHQIQVGLAFDGDADRVALLTNHYAFKGDELAILFAKSLAQKGKKPFIIGEVKCSQIMYDEINKIGNSLMYKTGHSNLKVKLKELNADLAVEMSGHIFFNDRYYGYDDAIYAGLRALELLLNQSPKDLQNIIAALPNYYNTPENKIQTTEEQKFILIEELKEKLKNPPKDFPKIKEIISIDGVRVIFENGWGLVRASNTTPVLVTRFEAKKKEQALEYEKALLSLLSL